MICSQLAAGLGLQALQSLAASLLCSSEPLLAIGRLRGVNDGDEDLNGDGLLGCCLSSCGEKREGCTAVGPAECGPGQACLGGRCEPWADFLCFNGESSPLQEITFPGGIADRDLPT